MKNIYMYDFFFLLVSDEIAEGNGVDSVTGGCYREESRACCLNQARELW